MIVFDLQAVQSVAHGERGIARFVGDLARTLAAEHPDVVDLFVWNDRFPHSDRIERMGLGDRLHSYSEVAGLDVDVLHINSPFEKPHIGDLLPPVRARRLVTTCYDLIPVQFPDLYLTDPNFRARYRARLGLLATSDAVLTDSRSAADDVHELLGVARDRITVIGAGVGPQFAPSVRSLAERLAVLRDAIPGIEARFVLVPTGMDPRKNTATMVEAYAALPAHLRERHQLVLSCKLDDEQRTWLDLLCDEHGVAGRVLVTGYVPDETLVALYQTTELVVFPSLYEGFGLPVLEARHCGARVICSNSSSLPEVLGEARARFNPGVVDEIAGTMEAALTDAGFAAMLDRIPDSGHTWSQAAARTAEVYHRLVAPARQRRHAETRRLAVVSPLPPAASGVADHSAQLLTELMEIDGVEPVAFSPHPVPGVHFRGGYELHHVAALPAMWAAGEVDAVVYCFGNHPLHRSFAPLLETVPGHVFLHDVRLRGALTDERAGAWQADSGDETDDLFVGPIASRAVSVLVQSRHAAELVEASAGVSAIDIGPHPCPAPVTPAASVEGSPWVVSLGVAHESKASDVVADAMSILVADGVGRAAMVGRDAERFVAAGSGITALDRVSDAEFDSWLDDAAVLVQLRRSTNGESSGVVARAMARGVPVVVSELGAMAELPDDAVVKVAATATPAEVAATVSTLLAEPDRRDALATAGRAYAEKHPMRAQAERLVEAVFSSRQQAR